MFTLLKLFTKHFYVFSETMHHMCKVSPPSVVDRLTHSSVPSPFLPGYIHDMYAPSRLYPSSLPSAKDHIPSNHLLQSTDLDLYAKVTPRDDDARSNASSGALTVRDDDQHSVASLESAEDLRKLSPASVTSTSSMTSGRTSPGKAAATFQSGITVAYTYDAFFITDGRSRRRNHLGLAVPDQPRPKYTCNECGKQYATSSNLSRHKQTHRSLESASAKKCPHCDKVYVSMPALSMHILTHDLKHTCPICSKSFSRPWLLQGHIRSHSGEKPYGCAHCGKAFADRSNLRAHMQTHSSFKHYKCKRCDKTFALKSYLNKHYESACLRDTASNTSSINSAPSSPEPIIDVQH